MEPHKRNERIRDVSPTVAFLASLPRGVRWTSVILIGVLSAFTAQTAVSQAPSADGVTWSRMFKLSDGRTFLTDGAFMLDSSFVEPREFANAELITPSLVVIEGNLAAQHPDEFDFEDLERGTQPKTYQAPSGVTLGARYVEYLRANLPVSSLRLRMKGDFDAVVIVSDDKPVGLLMPVKR